MRGRKHNLSIVCKTYDKDFDNFCRLYESIQRHNKDNIPFYVSTPEKDIELFNNYVGDEVEVMADESYAGAYFTKKEMWGLSAGYCNQEICKLSFWETRRAYNYLFVDSDAYFIRDFYLKDFMADEHTPYSVLTMDKDLHTEEFYREFGEYRRGHLKRIFETVGYEDRRLMTCHGMTVLSEKVLSDFKTKFLKKKNLSYEDILEISPYEYTWYNAWLQKSGVIDIVPVEPFFKVFHMRSEYVFSRLRLISEADIAAQYVGIIMNSNWKPKKAPERYKDPGAALRLFYRIVNKVL